MKDAGQKDLLYRHFRAQGWFPLVEVAMAPRGGSSERDKLITDVDVLALRPTSDLTWEYVVGDCKTRKGESPANRALWVRAVMQYLSAARGYMLLKRDSWKIEPDHKLMADQLGVTLLEEQEFPAFDRAVLYPHSSGRFPGETAADLRAFHTELRTRFARMQDLVDYLANGAWVERDHSVMVRQVLGRAASVRTEVDPAKDLHVGLALEAAAVFSVGLATCVGRIFHQFIATTNRGALEEALRVMLWGGRERYESAVAMKKDLTYPQVDPEALGLPQWARFMELVRSAIEAPRLMFKVPLVLRSLAMEEVKAVSRSAKTWDPMVLKLAMLAAAYVSEAARFPREMTEKISGVLVERISRAVDRRSSAAKERHAVAETSDDVAKAVSVLASINGLYAPNRTPGSLQALGTHGVYRKGVRFKTPDGDQARSRALIGLLGVAAQQGGFAVIQADDSIAIGIGPRPPAPSDLRLADSGDTQERLAVVVCSNGDIAMRITDGQSVDAEGWIDTSAAEPIDSLHTLSLAAGRGLEAILEMANPPRISDRA